MHPCRRRRPSLRAVPAPLLAALAATGCISVATPRLPADVAAGLAGRPMRTLETEHLVVHYPASHQDEARRVADHVEGCARYLTRVAHVHNNVADQKMTVLVPDLPYNNAFVAPRIAGYDTEAVVPTHDTIDYFSLEAGQPPDPAESGCHEIVHYVQFQQIAGFAWFWNALFGAVYTPQIGLDTWFDEGLAVYYETKLQAGTGRLAWPFWRGVFAAAYAGRRIDGGDLSMFQRDFYGGNHYLVGSQFIRFLADRYGEDRLWKVVHLQARSVLFPLGVSYRFWQAYGKTLSTLLDEFADDVAAHLPPRARPADQRVVRAAGSSARYARAANGSEALITADVDHPARLLVYGPDGRLRALHHLVDVVPPRRLAVGAPTLVSGLSFTSDGRALYFVSIDRAATYQASRLYRYDVDDDRLTVVNPDLGGPGGSLSPDGRQYYFARADGDRHDLAALDLTTGAVRVLAREPPATYLSGPRVSPDGRTIVATEIDHHQFRLILFDAASGQRLAAVPTGGAPVHDASWADDHRLVYLGGAADSAGFQVYLHDVASGRTQRVTAAPYLAFGPRAVGGSLRFLNRDGWTWTIDEVALPPPIATAATAASASPAAPVAAPIAAPTTTPPTAPTPPAQVTEVLSDRPYTASDILVPRLYGPVLGVLGGATVLGANLAGHDALSRHRWVLGGYYQFADEGAGGFNLGYSNRTLAPVTILALVSQAGMYDQSSSLSSVPPPTFYRRDRIATLEIDRAFFGNPIALGASFVETLRPLDPDMFSGAMVTRRVGGPHLSLAYAAAETTPYAAVRRLLAASAGAAFYPDAWSTAGGTFTDVRAQLDTVLPLPLSTRHTLSLGARYRDLLGRQGAPLLTVGGYTGALLGRHSNRPEVPDRDSPLLPAGVAFNEPLRGFEDYLLSTDGVAIGDASYRYPIIIDRGWASTAVVLPSWFLSQVDVELFGSVAIERRTRVKHAAYGGAVTLRTSLWVVPFSFVYQLARRGTDDQALTHLWLLTL